MKGTRPADAQPAATALPSALPVVAAIVPRADPEHPVAPTLPRDHPHWVRDTVSLSSRARGMLARVRPLAVRVMSFWDHAVRSLTIGRRLLTVDPAGSYRVE